MVAARATADRKTVGQVIVSGGHALPVLEPAEHDLYGVASLVATLVVFDASISDLRPWGQDVMPLACKASLNQSAS